MTSLSLENLKSSAQEIVGWLTSPRFVLENGMLSCVVNGKKSPYHLLPDLGDYLPFLIIFNAEEFAKQHMKDVVKLSPDGLVPTQIEKQGLKTLTSYEHTDFLLGLLDYYDLTGDKTYLPYTLTAAKKCIKTFKIGRLSRSYYSPQLHFSLPICDTRDGMFIELFNRLSKFDENFKQKSLQLFQSFIANKFFQKYSVFPEFILTSPLIKAASLISKKLNKRFKHVVATKNNTNTLFSFIDLYKKTEREDVASATIKLINGIQKQFSTGQALVRYKDKITDKPKTNEIDLGANFAFIDALCDSYQFLKYDKAKNMAVNIADYWLEQQSVITGLFPLTSYVVYDDLDCQTDMMIALIKLSEISGDRKYYQAAEKCLEGVLKYHRTPDGYYLSINIYNGQVVRKGYKTKFIALFLKALYCFIQQKPIYSDEEFFELLKDR